MAASSAYDGALTTLPDFSRGWFRPDWNRRIKDLRLPFLVLLLKVSNQFLHSLFPLLRRMSEIHLCPAAHILGQQWVNHGVQLGCGHVTVFVRIGGLR
jgi:hypothetical protein